MTDPGQVRAAVEQMSEPPHRWAEPVVFVPLADRLDAATVQQLMALARGGIGEPVTEAGQQHAREVLARSRPARS